MSKVEIPILGKNKLDYRGSRCTVSDRRKSNQKKTDEPGCEFVLFKGTHRLIKRKKFEEYINEISMW